MLDEHVLLLVTLHVLLNTAPSIVSCCLCWTFVSFYLHHYLISSHVSLTDANSSLGSASFKRCLYDISDSELLFADRCSQRSGEEWSRRQITLHSVQYVTPFSRWSLCLQYCCNGVWRHSVPHTHSEWATGAGGYVPVLWVLITEDGECTTDLRARLNRGRQTGYHCRRYGKVTACRFQRRYDLWKR